MSDLLTALGLMMAIEGALYAGFPAVMRRALVSLGEQSDQALRAGGLFALGCGFIVVWLIRG